MKRLLPLLAALCLSPAHAEDVQLSFNGTALNANLETSDNWPAGPTVLITHGTLFHNKSELVVALQELFAENDISSLAINLGLGIDNRSSAAYDCPTAHTHKHEDAAAEIGAWLDWLKTQGAKQVSLIGHSRGGSQTALYAAENDHALVKNVILIAPLTWTPDYAAKDYKNRYETALAPILKKAQGLVAAGKADTQLKNTGFIYCKDTSASAAAFVSYYSGDITQDTPTLLPKINESVLVFAASEDKIVKGLETTLAPMSEAGDIELTVIDGSDHFFRDLYAEEVVDRAVEFIGE